MPRMSEEGWKIKILARETSKAAFWFCREPQPGSPKAIREFT